MLTGQGKTSLRVAKLASTPRFLFFRQRSCCELSNVGLYAGPPKKADLYLQGLTALLHPRESVSKVATFKLSLADFVVFYCPKTFFQ